MFYTVEKISCISNAKQTHNQIGQSYISDFVSGVQSQHNSRPIIDSSNACNQASQFALNSIYFLNLNPINAKLTSLSYVHASKYICFSANVHRYHSNNRCGNKCSHNSSHKIVKFFRSSYFVKFRNS